ncbi:MAG: ribosomal-processing cysteine protease Prp [Clostridiaceae bacterium]|nr:ribosomal-processing cysteine protease Prp [Clostridiaceae bacterium]
MIIVSIKRNNKKEVMQFTISGHAYADEPGKDVVCAAVSVLSQTIILGLYEIIKIKAPYKIEDGYLSCEVPQNLSTKEKEKVNTLLETMVIGMKSVKENYNQYIDIHDKEV